MSFKMLSTVFFSTNQDHSNTQISLGGRNHHKIFQNIMKQQPHPCSETNAVKDQYNIIIPGPAFPPS